MGKGLSKKMEYVLQHTGRCLFVGKNGKYIGCWRDAKKYGSIEEADKDRCANEKVVTRDQFPYLKE
jgi:hypothetical protein